MLIQWIGQIKVMDCLKDGKERLVRCNQEISKPTKLDKWSIKLASEEKEKMLPTKSELSFHRNSLR